MTRATAQPGHRPRPPRPLARALGSRTLPALLAAGALGLLGCGGTPGGDAEASEAAADDAAADEAADLTGQVILVTGSTGGLGREVARRLAARGAHVVVHGRNEERGRALVEEIERGGTGGARFYAADLASFDEVRAFAEAVRRDYDRLDVLVNNAGIWLEGEERVLSEDGHELTFQVNYLSGYLLTRMLLPLLRESAPARIVNVSSVAQRPIDFDDPMMERGYSDGRAYAQSKLAQVLFTFDLARELEGTGVTANALHPATMMDTDMVLERGAQPRSSVEEGTEAVVNLVTAPDPGSGRYFNGLNPAEPHEQASDEEARARLRALSEALTGA